MPARGRGSSTAPLPRCRPEAPSPVEAASCRFLLPTVPARGRSSSTAPLPRCRPEAGAPRPGLLRRGSAGGARLAFGPSVWTQSARARVGKNREGLNADSVPVSVSGSRWNTGFREAPRGRQRTESHSPRLHRRDVTFTPSVFLGTRTRATCVHGVGSNVPSSAGAGPRRCRPGARAHARLHLLAAGPAGGPRASKARARRRWRPAGARATRVEAEAGGRRSGRLGAVAVGHPGVSRASGRPP